VKSGKNNKKNKKINLSHRLCPADTKKKRVKSALRFIRRAALSPEDKSKESEDQNNFFGNIKSGVKKRWFSIRVMNQT
jgi:hypothetical protein